MLFTISWMRREGDACHTVTNAKSKDNERAKSWELFRSFRSSKESQISCCFALSRSKTRLLLDPHFQWASSCITEDTTITNWPLSDSLVPFPYTCCFIIIIHTSCCELWSMLGTCLHNLPSITFNSTVEGTERLEDLKSLTFTTWAR